MKINLLDNKVFEKIKDINFVFCNSFQSVETVSKNFKSAILSDGKKVLDDHDLPIAKENIDFWLVKWDMNYKKELSFGSESVFYKDICQWMIDNNFEQYINSGLQELQNQVDLYLKNRQIDFIKVFLSKDYEQEPEKTIKNYFSFSFGDEISGIQKFRYIFIKYIINKFLLSNNKHKLIVIESPEMLLNEQINQIKIDAIKNKIKIIFISSDSGFIQKNFIGELFYEQNSKIIKKWELSKNLIYEYIAINNYDEKKFSDYALYFHDILKVITDEDLIKEKAIVCKRISSYILSILIDKKIENIENFDKLFVLFLEVILNSVKE